MKRTYSGADEGKGSIYEWDGNDEVGSGRMEILETKPPNLVTIKLDFIKPFEGHNIAEFKIEPGREATDVSWGITGPVPFCAKIFHVFMDMDKMIGGDFEAGLQSLKTLAEAPAPDVSSEATPANEDKTADEKSSPETDAAIAPAETDADKPAPDKDADKSAQDKETK